MGAEKVTADAGKADAVCAPDRDPHIDWVLAAGDGDIEAYNKLFNEYKPMVFGYFRKWEIQPADADDLVQAVFMTVLSSAHKFRERPGGRVGGWLFTLARFQRLHFHWVARIKAGDPEVRRLDNEMKHRWSELNPQKRKAAVKKYESKPETKERKLELQRERRALEKAAKLMLRPSDPPGFIRCSGCKELVPASEIKNPKKNKKCAACLRAYNQYYYAKRKAEAGRTTKPENGELI